MQVRTYYLADNKYPQKPREDEAKDEANTFCVADGITRDPVGIDDFTGLSKEEWLQSYPDPSPATQAASVACETFVQQVAANAAADALIAANQAIAEINERLDCDYLEHDYAGCVAAGGKITDRGLEWASIGDCFVSILDKAGNTKFISPHGTKAWQEYEQTHELGDWNKPEYRRLVRQQYRNNPSQIVDGELVSYGSLTGETTAESFMASGQEKLRDDDIVLCFSDGVYHLARHPDFWHQLNQDEEVFEKWMQELAAADYSKYGHERMLIVIKI